LQRKKKGLGTVAAGSQEETEIVAASLRQHCGITDFGI